MNDILSGEFKIRPIPNTTKKEKAFCLLFFVGFQLRVIRLAVMNLLRKCYEISYLKLAVGNHN